MEQTVELIKAIFVWPFTTLVMVVFVSSVFRQTISEWISKLSIKGNYGDAAFSAQSQVVETAKEKSPPKDMKPVEQSGSSKKELSASNQAEALKMAAAWKATSYLWEYRYLNYYLIEGTKQTLEWFNTLNEPINYGLFDAFIMKLVPNANERAARFEALTKHHLVEDNQGLLKITEKGKEYLQYRKAI